MEKNESAPTQVQEVKYPTEIASLASGGKYYSKDSPLSSGKIELKIPTALQEDILTSRNLIQKGIVIDEFLKSIIVNKDINYDELLLGDKNGLIIVSRILLYGPNYEVKYNCPVCGYENTLEIDISELKIKELDNSVSVDGNNEFEFILPVSKKKIKFKLLRHHDETVINNTIKKLKKYMTKGISSEVTTRLSHIITEIEGKRNFIEIEKFVKEQMTTRDSKALREKINKVIPGMDTQIDFICEECGHEQEMSLPMDINFFWPGGQS